MSYCVNCGVQLDATASSCPLCQTRVINPAQPVDTKSPKPFPTQRGVVAPVSKFALAMLLSAILASVAIVCVLLNLMLDTDRIWSIYVIGAALTLWIWLVPPLLMRGMLLSVRLLLDICAVTVYAYLIAADIHHEAWFWRLAVPILMLGGGMILLLGTLVFRGKRCSALAGITIVTACVGAFLFGVEIFADHYFTGVWRPDWSLVVLAVCIVLMIPLLIINWMPSLREEVQRRFHI